MSFPTGASELNMLLFQGGARVVNVKFFVGDGSFTQAELTSEVTSALQQRADGSAVVSERFNDDAAKIDVRAFVATLQQ